MSSVEKGTHEAEQMRETDGKTDKRMRQARRQ